VYINSKVIPDLDTTRELESFAPLTTARAGIVARNVAALLLVMRSFSRQLGKLAVPTSSSSTTQRLEELRE
jgi:hypothetical protein